MNTISTVIKSNIHDVTVVSDTVDSIIIERLSLTTTTTTNRNRNKKQNLFLS